MGPSPGNLEPKEGGPTSHFLCHWPHPALGCPGQSTSSSGQGCTPESAGQDREQTDQDGQLPDDPPPASGSSGPEADSGLGGQGGGRRRGEPQPGCQAADLRCSHPQWPLEEAVVDGAAAALACSSSSSSSLGSTPFIWCSQSLYRQAPSSPSPALHSPLLSAPLKPLSSLPARRRQERVPGVINSLIQNPWGPHITSLTSLLTTYLPNKVASPQRAHPYMDFRWDL